MKTEEEIKDKINWLSKQKGSKEWENIAAGWIATLKWVLE